MLKFLIFIFLLIPLCMRATEVKEEIALFQEELSAPQSAEKRAESLYRLACAYFKDQEIDKAFHYFLLALKSLPLKSLPEMDQEEKEIYEKALSDYMNGAGSDPVRVANRMLEKYGNQADAHEEWIYLNFLIATAYANLGHYKTFFDRFYHGYPYLGETFLAYKTRGILYLRLSHHGRSIEERQTYHKEAFRYLTLALDRNPKDSSLYKVLIFLAKDEKNDSLVLNYLQKMVEHEAHISRGDICLYVREAVALGELHLGRQIIDLARTQYDFSRAISAAQEYLNQCSRG